MTCSLFACLMPHWGEGYWRFKISENFSILEENKKTTDLMDGDSEKNTILIIIFSNLSLQNTFVIDSYVFLSY